MGLISALFCNVALSVTDKASSSKLKNTNEILYFSFLKTLLCFVFALILLVFGTVNTDLAGIVISVFAGLFHVASVILIMRCLKLIPAVYVNLFLAAGVIIPSVFGWLFLNEQVTVLKIVCLILLILSLVFTMNIGKAVGFPIKLPCLMFFCYGMLMLMQGIFPKYSKAGNGAMFSAVMYGSSAVILGIIFAFKKEKRPDFSKSLKALCITASGLNLIINLLLTALSKTLTAATVFPTVHGLKLVFITLISPFLWKEKLSPIQIAGSFTAIICVCILSL